MPSRSAGGYDFASTEDTTDTNLVLWTASALPSVIALTELPTELTTPAVGLLPLPLDTTIAAVGADHIVKHRGALFRVNIEKTGTRPSAVLLPLDELFEIRATTTVRLWRSLTGRHPGSDPAALPKARQNRLVLALRALDGRLEHATYREIAIALFGDADVSGRGWKSHDLRDRTIRLVRLGTAMMLSDYRRLLRYPYRRR